LEKTSEIIESKYNVAKTFRIVMQLHQEVLLTRKKGFGRFHLI